MPPTPATLKGARRQPPASKYVRVRLFPPRLQGCGGNVPDRIAPHRGAHVDGSLYLLSRQSGDPGEGRYTVLKSRQFFQRVTDCQP